MLDIKILQVNTGAEQGQDIISKKLKEKYNLELPNNFDNIYSEGDRFSNSFNSLEVYTFSILDKRYILKSFSQSTQNKNIYMTKGKDQLDTVLLKLADLFNQVDSLENLNYSFKTYADKTLFKNKKFKEFNIIENIRVKYNTIKTSATNTINVSNLLLLKENGKNKLCKINFQIKTKV